MNSIKENTVTETITETTPTSGYFPKWLVILHNDNKTHYQFVIQILMKYFNKTLKAANEITEEVHKKGKGIAGIYAKEQAEFRAVEVMKIARQSGFPLTLTIEKE